MCSFKALLVYFRNRREYNVAIRHRYSIPFRGGGWKGDQNIKIQVFIYSNAEDVARIFLLFQ